ncbi:hypothetical protein J2Z31_001792 [Sinorhizobium kostiense]|uniref:Periplasmic protein-like protein n=1 Tax=Sinorhizobium kostiense TaxID=76747 RepID=A0ABS4QXC1_9HYPH|nr:hypothetical protein [Sinorhizobium kostiense]MBP2235300.1 hypothetical protein [Sinorhizobium kostiense]
MRIGVGVWSLFAGFLAVIPHAHAAVSIEKLQIQGGETVLVVRGEFEFGDRPEALSAAVAQSGARVVTFNSNGGNVHAAMAFGRTIRALGLETVQLRAAECASACALAFVGGARRTAEPGSIGVHQSSFSGDAALDGHEAVAAVQAMTAEIMTYLIEMGVDPKLLQLSLSIPSSDIRYLTAGEMTQFGVTTSVPTTNQTVTAAAGNSPPMKQGSTIAAPSEEARALRFIADYHDAWSRANPEAMGFMNTAYADSVSFYGKTVSRDDVLKEKAAFAERWPQRAYSVKYRSERVVCAATCTVSGVVEWFAHSLRRAKSSSGIADFSLIWDPSTSRIMSETGKVLAVDRKAREPARIISQWHDQNGDCRGGSGDSDETWKACDRREAIGAKLQAVGWCFGRDGEAGYQMEWHACGR